MEVDHENDLPVMANTQDVLVRHFLLDLTCCFDEKVLHGSILLFLDPANSGENKQIFSLQDALLGKVTPIMCENQRDQGTDFKVVKDKTLIPLLNCASSSQIAISSEDRQVNNASAEGKLLAGRSISKLPAPDLCEAKETAGSITSLFHLVLDCCDLTISDVEEVILPDSIADAIQRNSTWKLQDSAEDYLGCFDCSRQKLLHETDKWCLRVWKPNITSAQDFPRVVRVNYSTQPEGRSLRWAQDQDGRPCVYSAAMWVNNRALFPCQEYGSLATWQARITVPPGGDAVVLMSSDQEEKVTCHEGSTQFYHECSSPLPSYTLALAVGYWSHQHLGDAPHESGSETNRCPEQTCQHALPCQILYSQNMVMPCRVFAPPSLLPQAVAEFAGYYPRCSHAIQEILGASPFPRVDFVFYPSCSQDMAMSNGGLIFLSQSVLASDGSMCVRIAHELSHYWFGLLIGSKDWTEEWLSEGFATFIEDHIHARAMKWNEEQTSNFSEVRALLWHKNLEGEVAHTQDQLQTLRPQKGEDLIDPNSSIMYVKNGLNPYKQFTQVHYLKGYFLLRHLCSLVGREAFLELLKQHVIQHHGQLIYSQDFLAFVVQQCPKLNELGITVPVLIKDWLDCSGMPQALEMFSADSIWINEVNTEMQVWEKINMRCRKGKKKPKIESEEFRKLEPVQLILLLENFLTWKSVTTSVLSKLRQVYQLDCGNPEVRHRWNELIVKHKYFKYYDDVRTFLINEQAMGVYLYGEMVISGCKKLKHLAHEVFLSVGPLMERGTYHTVHKMLYGE